MISKSASFSAGPIACMPNSFLAFKHSLTGAKPRPQASHRLLKWFLKVEAFVFCCVLRRGEARFVLITDQSVRQTVP